MHYLNLDDLASMALSCTRFEATALYLFRHKHADKLIRFHSPSSSIEQYEKFINVLTAFGEHIRKLRVTFNTDSKFHKHDKLIFLTLVEKCSKSIVELNLSLVRPDMIITKPFNNLRNLIISDSCLDSSVVNLPKGASNLTSLEYHNVENVLSDQVVNLHLPLLMHFGNFNQIIENPERELENLQNFRRFVNANQQLTSFGFGAKELSYMLKYKLYRQQFYNEMHPGELCPDERNFITYLFPFEPVYLQNLKHLHIRLGEMIKFLQILRHRLINIGQLPINRLQLHIDYFQLEGMDLVQQFRRLKKIQYYLNNRLCKQTVSHIISMPYLIVPLVDIEVFILNDIDYKNYAKLLIQDMCIMINQHDKLRRLLIGFQLTCPFDHTNMDFYQRMVHQDEPDLHKAIRENLPPFWRYEIKMQIINVQRERCTQDALVLCIILTNIVRYIK